MDKPAITSRDVAWLAGLLEGEGCFFSRKNRPTPVIQLCMTDPDVVIRAAALLRCNRVIRCKNDTRGGKALYRTVLFGRDAVGWCMTLYPLMGVRRQQKIKEMIEKWKASQRSAYLRRNCTSRGAEVIWLNNRFVNKAA